jgi:hypothetical protein
MKKADNRSKSNIGCVELRSTRGRHTWVCTKNGTVVATSPILSIASKKYDSAAAKRLETMREAVNAHGHEVS